MPGGSARHPFFRRLCSTDIGAPAPLGWTGAPPPSDAVTDNPVRLSVVPLSIRSHITLA
ncbi:hypothetical protein GCM10011576_21760 [Micromonospora parathelypteridis]|nr:hypothetical protein GCM10011576_21760 [Micromonospora parathelypteridis]